MRHIHTILRLAALPAFVTLTFPDLFPDYRTAKRLIDVLGKRWRRRWRGCCIVWRMEIVPRKSGSGEGQLAPHFHLLVWGQFDADKAREDWFEVCGSSEYAHWRHGLDAATEMKSWQEAGSYCSKYIAKECPLWIEGGRIWGIIGRKAMPCDKRPVKVRLTWREAFAVKRALRNAMAVKCGRPVRHALSLYTSDPESFLRLLALLRGINLAGRPQQMSRHQHWTAALRT